MTGAKQFAQKMHTLLLNAPQPARFASAWILSNAEPIGRLLENSYMDVKDRKKYMESAWTRQDYKAWILLLFQQFIQEGASTRQ